MPWLIPVDLGQANDYTAVGAVELSPVAPRSCFVGFMRRWRGLPYPETVRRVVELANAPQLRDAVLVVDMGGVGRGVIDSIRAALPARVVYGVTLTHGQRTTAGQHRWDVNVPKKDVITSAQQMLQATPKRLTIPRELPDRVALEDELANYRVKITEHLNETFAAARETDHDDMVIAVAMACWVAEKLPGPTPDARDIVLNMLSVVVPESDRPRSRLETIANEFPELFAR